MPSWMAGIDRQPFTRLRFSATQATGIAARLSNSLVDRSDFGPGTGSDIFPRCPSSIYHMSSTAFQAPGGRGSDFPSWVEVG
jgi:hypothetical protein